ncbi:MAG: hypothetical protein K8J08_13710 [Thermoanaerobaculia bacterium]|nr:hypothetical protein [Thermoanaerobaculia bacterium]
MGAGRRRFGPESNQEAVRLVIEDEKASKVVADLKISAEVLRRWKQHVVAADPKAIPSHSLAGHRRLLAGLGTRPPNRFRGHCLHTLAALHSVWLIVVLQAPAEWQALHLSNAVASTWRYALG